MNVLVLSELDDPQLSDLAALLTRCQEYDGLPAMAEPQRAAAARRDLGAQGALAILAYEGAGEGEGSAGDRSLIGCAFITPATDGATALHVAIDPPHRHDSVHVSGTPGDNESIKTALIRVALEHVNEAHTSHETVRLWLMEASDDDDVDAALLGFTPERDLLQMLVPLPLPPEILAGARPVVTRPFEPGRDDQAWLDINNRAFAGHPEQGGWTLEDLHERIGADWFDPNAFLMVDKEDGTGLLGSCWNKVHTDTRPVEGEIYVISVDPAEHGGGWGRALTVAGLQWIAAQGITVGMLYTTSSNVAAVALYTSLGFTIDHVDRSYVRQLNPVPMARPMP